MNLESLQKLMRTLQLVKAALSAGQAKTSVINAMEQVDSMGRIEAKKANTTWKW